MDGEQERAYYAPSGAEQIAQIIKLLNGAEMLLGFGFGLLFSACLATFISGAGKGELAGCETIEKSKTFYVATTPECLAVLQSVVKEAGNDPRQ